MRWSRAPRGAARSARWRTGIERRRRLVEDLRDRLRRLAVLRAGGEGAGDDVGDDAGDDAEAGETRGAEREAEHGTDGDGGRPDGSAPMEFSAEPAARGVPAGNAPCSGAARNGAPLVDATRRQRHMDVVLLRCDACTQEYLRACSCKCRYFRPSCHAKWLAS